jgi:ABC-type transport system involved in multi-copper enzyme maturation permease subunit
VNPRRFLRLLRLDLHLFRRHGALLSISVFTLLICVLTWFGFRAMVQDLPSGFLLLGDPIAAGSEEFPGAEISWRGMASIAMTIRTFPFCLPLILVVLTGRVVANSIKNHTMREDLARPIAREWLLAIRFSALSIYSLLSLVICVVFSFVFSYALGLEAVHQQLVDAGHQTYSVGVLLQGMGLIWLTDMAVIAMALLVSVLVQPAGRMLLILILGFVMDALVRTSLEFYASIKGPKGEWAADLAGWFPGEALDAWQQWPQEYWDGTPLAATCVLLVGSLVLCVLRFRRMDIT